MLRRLNILIKYILGYRNKVANSLLRTLFRLLDYTNNPTILDTSVKLYELESR